MTELLSIHFTSCGVHHVNTGLDEAQTGNKIAKRNINNLIYVDTPAAAPKSRQLCPTLCDPKDCSPPGSSVPGILQARILDGVGCHFLLQNRYISDLNLQAVLS